MPHTKEFTVAFKYIATGDIMITAATYEAAEEKAIKQLNELKEAGDFLRSPDPRIVYGDDRVEVGS